MPIAVRNSSALKLRQTVWDKLVFTLKRVKPADTGRYSAVQFVENSLNDGLSDVCQEVEYLSIRRPSARICVLPRLEIRNHILDKLEKFIAFVHRLTICPWPSMLNELIRTIA